MSQITTFIVGGICTVAAIIIIFGITQVVFDIRDNTRRKGVFKVTLMTGQEIYYYEILKVEYRGHPDYDTHRQPHGRWTDPDGRIKEFR